MNATILPPLEGLTVAQGVYIPRNSHECIYRHTVPSIPATVTQSARPDNSDISLPPPNVRSQTPSRSTRGPSSQTMPLLDQERPLRISLNREMLENLKLALNGRLSPPHDELNSLHAWWARLSVSGGLGVYESTRVESQDSVYRIHPVVVLANHYLNNSLNFRPEIEHGKRWKAVGDDPLLSGFPDYETIHALASPISLGSEAVDVKKQVIFHSVETQVASVVALGQREEQKTFYIKSIEAGTQRQLKGFRDESGHHALEVPKNVLKVFVQMYETLQTRKAITSILTSPERFLVARLVGFRHVQISLPGDAGRWDRSDWEQAPPRVPAVHPSSVGMASDPTATSESIIAKAIGEQSIPPNPANDLNLLGALIVLASSPVVDSPSLFIDPQLYIKKKSDPKRKIEEEDSGERDGKKTKGMPSTSSGIANVDNQTDHPESGDRGEDETTREEIKQTTKVALELLATLGLHDVRFRCLDHPEVADRYQLLGRIPIRFLECVSYDDHETYRSIPSLGFGGLGDWDLSRVSTRTRLTNAEPTSRSYKQRKQNPPLTVRTTPLPNGTSPLPNGTSTASIGNLSADMDPSSQQNNGHNDGADLGSKLSRSAFTMEEPLASGTTGSSFSSLMCDSLGGSSFTFGTDPAIGLSREEDPKLVQSRVYYRLSASIELRKLIGTGRLYTSFYARLDIRFCGQNGSVTSIWSGDIIAKLGSVSGPAAAVDDGNRYTREAAREAALHEAGIYEDHLLAYQGSLVPRWYGLWSGSQAGEPESNRSSDILVAIMEWGGWGAESWEDLQDSEMDA
ncbi:hypothetical protein P7C73_g6639, partial [Tremellales sp. Uapishka_1]